MLIKLFSNNSLIYNSVIQSLLFIDFMIKQTLYQMKSTFNINQLSNIKCLWNKKIYSFSKFNKIILKNSSKSIAESKQQLSQIISSQLKEQQSNKYNINQFQSLLNSINWIINKIPSNTHLQLNKKTLTHQFNAFITIKPPISLNQQHQTNLQEQKKFQIQMIQEQLKKNKDPQLKKQLSSAKQFIQQKPYQQNVCQITIFVNKLENQKIVNKRGSKSSPIKNKQTSQKKQKYVCLQFIANSRYVQLQDINIYSRIIPYRIDRIRQCHQFGGRGLGLVNYQIRQLLFMEIQSSWELRKQVLQTMFQLTLCYQQQQYINWLKIFNSIL